MCFVMSSGCVVSPAAACRSQRSTYSASHPSCDAFGPLLWQFMTLSMASRVFHPPPALPLPILSRIILQRLPAYCGYTLRLSFHHASAFSAGAQNQEQKEHFRTARAQGQRTSFPLCLRLPLYGGAAIFNVLGLKNHAHPGRVFCPRRGYFHSRN